MRNPYDISPDALSLQRLASSATAAVAALDLEQIAVHLELEHTPRDEAALLLTVGAEVEHALLVQYLYAAYSVRYDQADHALRGRVRGLYMGIVQIAREEMGHLMTVQNLLHLIGAPLNFHREHSPFASELYPFRFKLEPLSSHALAKYITAERPATKPVDLPQRDWNRLGAIAQEAQCANDGRPIQHVGPIYARLIELFSDSHNGIKDEDFRTDTSGLQATWRDWGYDESLDQEDDSRRVFVDTCEGRDPQVLREQAVKALQAIAEQGEGYGNHVDSHFERFFQLYDTFQALKAQGVDLVWPVATNPNTLPRRSTPLGAFNLPEAAQVAFEARGHITDTRSRAWGHLFNFRYRLLLAYLLHFLRSDGLRYVDAGPDKGDRTPRGLLLLWTFDEMRHLKKIAEKLVRLPLRDPYDGVNAGPPFQLPYTLTLADWDRTRWRAHLDTVRASLKLVRGTLRAAGSPDEADPFLEDLQTADERRETILAALAAGQPIPAASQPKAFQKVALRGYPETFFALLQRDQAASLR